jgi:single-stranded DNA-binding protein
VSVSRRLASRHPAWRDQVAEFASSLKKGAHLHLTGYLRSREIEKKGTGRGKKSGASVKVQAWEVRAIRIAKLDRAVQEDPSTQIPADDPANNPTWLSRRASGTTRGPFPCRSNVSCGFPRTSPQTVRFREALSFCRIRSRFASAALCDHGRNRE